MLLFFQHRDQGRKRVPSEWQWLPCKSMQASDISGVYVTVAAGFAIWFIGQMWGGHKTIKKGPSKVGRYVSLLGGLVFAVGVYAGLKGPLTIGRLNLDRFPFFKILEQRNAEALTYAIASLNIKREPSIGWHGAMKTSLQYTVKNNGGKEIGRLTVRLLTISGAPFLRTVHGPFPPGRATVSVVELPSSVSPAYFCRAPANEGEVVEARF